MNIRMKHSFKSALLLGMSLLAVGCSTVTIRDQGTQKLVAEPSYESSKAFFLGGLVGEAHVDVDQICGSNVPKQLQAQHTFVDSLLTGLTLGIYAPRTVKVWCGPAQKAPAIQKKGS
jgi:hypothetical protein